MSHATFMDKGRPASTGYLRTVWDLLRRPRVFFAKALEEHGLFKALKYLAISSLMVGATCLLHDGGPTLMAMIVLFVNAMAMPFISAAVGLPAAALLARGELNMPKYFAVFAYAGGTAALLAWHPAFLWLAESIKWVLVGFGLVHGCGLKRWPAFFVMITSIILTIGLLALMASWRV